MKKNNIIILSLFIFLTLGIVLFNYANQLTSLIAEAVAPNPGHSWDEMECTTGLCITDTGIGIGVTDPGASLEVVGGIIVDNIQASSNVCLDSGVCLSQIGEYVDNQLLVYGAHNFGDCTTAGGTLEDDTDSSMKFCKFTGSSCPSVGGWTQYKNWTITTAKTCQATVDGGQYGVKGCSICTTGSHSTIANIIETCSFGGIYNGHSDCSCGSNYTDYREFWRWVCTNCPACTCTANITSVGCY